MKYTDLKVGEIYYCDWSKEYQYIFKKEEGDNNCSNVELNGRQYRARSGMFYNCKEEQLREATTEEKGHFLACEKAGTYIKRKPIVDYQIY